MDELAISNAEEVAVAALPKNPPKRKNLVVGNEKQTIASLVGALKAERYGERYGLTTIQSLKLPATRSEELQLIDEMYYEEGVVKNAINLFVDFCASKMRNVSEDQKIKDFFDKFCKYSDMDNLIRQIFLSYFLYGDAFVYRGELASVDNGKDKGAVYCPYTLLNVASIEVEEVYMFGREAISFKIPNEVKTIIQKAKRKNARLSEEEKQVLNSLPKEFRQPQFTSKGNILLDEDKLLRISYKRLPWNPYSIPPFSGAFIPYKLKKRMRELDLATAEGTINSIMLVKVGSDQYPATRKQLDAVANLFQTGAKSLTLFWNHAIEIEQISGNIEALDEDKYRQINRDLLNALGIPASLVGGMEEGGRFANAWASMVALAERLENARRTVKRALEFEFRRIANECGLKDAPKMEFKKMNLRDANTFKALLTAMYDRGLLDIDTVLDEMDYDFEEIVQKKKEQENVSGLFLSPFGGGGFNLAPPVPKAPSGKEGGEGRPPADVAPTYKERRPQEGPRTPGR